MVADGWAGCLLAAYFAFRKSPTSSSTNSLSSALLGSRLEENGRLLSLPARRLFCGARYSALTVCEVLTAPRVNVRRYAAVHTLSACVIGLT